MLNKGRVKNIRAPRAKRKQARPQEAVFGPDREEGKEVAFRVCGERRRQLLRAKSAKSVPWTRKLIFREDSTAFHT